MVDGAKAMIASMGIEDVMKSLSKINNWTELDDGNPTEMKFSENGAEMLAKFEKFVPNPYLDMVGVWTIGYGNTYYLNGRRVGPNDPHLTKEQATKLKMDIVNRDFAAAVNIMFADVIERGRMTQNMFDALVMLAYNIGTNALQGSSVARLLKANKKAAAADAFKLWNKGKVNGRRRVIKGLVNRRAIERELFLS
jgi:lysozyme